MISPTIVEMKVYPESRLQVLRTSRITGAMTCQFITDCRPYKQGDTVVLYPYETNAISCQ